MKNTELTGAVRGLMDEYRRAINELINVIKPIDKEKLTMIIDKDTKDPECKSIQTVLTHTVSSGYSYSVYIENYIGLNTQRPKQKFYDNVNQYIGGLNSMFEYCENVFRNNAITEIEQLDNSKKIIDRIGQQYDIEQLIEHAIVHILRHRRQIEKFLQKMDTDKSDT